MVLDHVPECSGGIIVASSIQHSYAFRSGNLDIVYVFVVPDRLEDGIGEAEGEYVLDRFLSDVVIYSIDLLLPKHLHYLRIQSTCCAHIRSERFLEYHFCIPGSDVFIVVDKTREVLG